MSDIIFDFPSLDKKDREILFELDRDARQSNSSIAEKTGLDKNVVNYRINKLVEGNVIEGFYTVINSAKLGYQSYRVYLKLHFISHAKEKEIKSYIIKSPLTWWVGESDGEFDIAFLVWVRNITELREFWRGFTGKYQKHIQKNSISVYTKIHDFSYAFFFPEKVLERTVQEVEASETVEISEIEKKVLRIISGNARMPTVEIAKNLGITAMQVKYAIKQLKEKGIILGYRTKMNLKALGLTNYKAYFQLKDLDQYDEMAAFVRSKPNVIYIDESIGFADFEVEVLVQKHSEFSLFVDEFKDRFSEKIKDYNYFIYTDISKINYSPLQ